MAARESMRREKPLKIMLMPTSVPMTQMELAGQERQIMMARMRVMTPSTMSQPAPWRGRSWKYWMNSTMASKKR